MKSLGRGGCGEAFLIEGKKTKKQVVLKEVDMSDINEENIEDVTSEASIMKLLKHPNIIQIIDVYKTKCSKLCIIMEFAAKGDLNDYIENRKTSYEGFGEETSLFSEQVVLDIFAQLVMALGAIHSQNVKKLFIEIYAHKI